MKNITQLVFKAKKGAIAKGVPPEGTAWFDNDDPDEVDALSTLAIKAAGFKRSDFFKPVRVDHLVVDDMPEEGVFDTAFCERYKLAEDGKSWLLPVAQTESTDSGTGENSDSISEGHTNENATDNTDSGDTASTTSTNSAATAAADSDSATSATDTTGSTNTAADTSNEVAGSETATDTAPSCDVNINGEQMNEVEKDMDWPMKDLPLPVRWMAQRGMDSKVLFLKPAERERLTGIMEADENHSQHLTNIKAITTGEMAPEIEKLTTYHLHRLVTAFDKVSEKVERMGPSMSGRFVRAWLDTEYIDQGILVNEWCAGRHVSHIEKPKAASVSEVPVTQKTPAIEVTVTARPHRSEKPTHRTINYELACGFYEDLDLNNLRPAMDFAKRIIAEDREDWKRMSMTVGIIPDIKGYDRQTIIDLVRKAPAAVHSGSPELRRTWCESFLAVHGVRDPDWYEHTPDNAPATHEENSARIRKAGKSLRDIKEGRFNDVEEKPQPAAVLADEPAASETVEQDTTEHHQDLQQVETESSVADDGDQDIREKFSEQLAAGRGDFVPGISDPSDPKWVRDDYSASNKGEKTENEDADDVNQNDDTVIKNADSVNHPESSADQIEPEVPETEPKSPQPDPVTKVADGVFDASAFFADTSNEGEKTENPTSINNDRSTEVREEKNIAAFDPNGPVLEKIARLLEVNNQLLEMSISHQVAAFRRREKFLKSLVLALTTCCENHYTEDETDEQ